MKTGWVLTQEAFDSLLEWLDSDRERAGRKYEEIRLRLIKIFTCRGCLEAEDLADETINRVTTKVSDVAKIYKGDPALYFYGVSQKVQLEYLRKPRTKEGDVSVAASTSAPNSTGVADTEESEYQCLETCLGELSAQNRTLVVEYYRHEKRTKIDHRKRLADELGIATNALRIRAHRVRRMLQECVQNCLTQQHAN